MTSVFMAMEVLHVVSKLFPGTKYSSVSNVSAFFTYKVILAGSGVYARRHVGVGEQATRTHGAVAKALCAAFSRTLS